MALRVDWSDHARADVRCLDKPTAMRILDGLHRFLVTEHGDVKQLQGVDPPEFRLRLGDYRLRFSQHGDTLRIHSVKHRSEAYR
jgi:mRNA interferase RelE/StbE